MEDVVHAGHHVPQALDVAHVPDVELDFFVMFGIVGLQLMAHVVLLLFVAGKNADLPDVGG